MAMNERKVLIIEPDDELARIVERFLLSNRFQVARARDIDQGRWMACAIKPHVVLLDPGSEDGIEVAERFRNDEAVKEFPLVIMLQEDFDEPDHDLTKSLHEIYDGFLYKPFADTELLRVVENFTGFGDSQEKVVENELDNILRETKTGPELRSVVQELQSRKSQNKGDSKNELTQKIDKLEEELAEAKEHSKKQAERISDLLNSISDLELDHSFTVENLEAEKDQLIEEVNKLTKRVKELENANAQVLKMIDSVNKTLKKNK